MDTKSAQRQLIGLITQHLSESIPVTRILKYQPSKNGSVDGRFESLGRVFNFTFNGNDVKYKPSGNMDSDLFSEYYLERFDAAPATPKGTKAMPKCTSKSYSCKGAVGVRCLPLTLNCKMGTDAIGTERLGKVEGLSKMLAGSGGDTSKLEASKGKIVDQRKALAAENKAKREPKKVEQKAQKPKEKDTVEQRMEKGYKYGKLLNKASEKAEGGSSKAKKILEGSDANQGAQSLYGKEAYGNSPSWLVTNQRKKLSKESAKQAAESKERGYTHEGDKSSLLKSISRNQRKTKSRESNKKP